METLTEKAEMEAVHLINHFRFDNSVILDESAQRETNRFLTDRIEQQNTFTYMGVLDPFGRMVLYSRDPRASSILGEDIRKQVFELRHPGIFKELNEIYVPLLNAQGEPYGIVRLGVQESEIRGVPVVFLMRVIPLALLSALVAIGISSFVSRRFFSRSLAPLINSVERVAEGDFTRRVDTIAVRDELLDLTSSLNHLFETIEMDKRDINRFKSDRDEFERHFVRVRNESTDRLLDIERRADEMESRFMKLLELSWQGILVFDQTGKVLACNTAVQRTLRLDRQGKDLFVPERVQRMIARLFGSTTTEQVEGSFEVDDGVFLKHCRFRFRAQRLLSHTGQQKVLVVFDDHTRTEQIETVKESLTDLLRKSFAPVLHELHDKVALLEDDQPQDEKIPGMDERIEEVRSGLTYLDNLMEDWLYWDEKNSQIHRPELESLDLKKLIESMTLERLKGFSNDIHLHLPDQAPYVQCIADEIRKLIRETFTLLQLAVPGSQDSAVDLIVQSESLILNFRKSAQKDDRWDPPAWLERLSGKQPVHQDSWINLKISIIRMLLSIYGANISKEIIRNQDRSILIIRLEIPIRQSVGKRQDKSVDDLIKRFFVAQV